MGSSGIGCLINTLHSAVQWELRLSSVSAYICVKPENLNLTLISKFESSPLYTFPGHGKSEL